MAIKMYKGSDKAFLKACTLAGIPPAKRRRKKWEKQRGKAWANREA